MQAYDLNCPSEDIDLQNSLPAPATEADLTHALFKPRASSGEIGIQSSDGHCSENALTKAARQMGIAWVAE